MNARHGFLLLMILAASLAVTGCGSAPPESTVSGKVLLKGEPLTAGAINFIDPTQGIGAAAPLGPGGEFAVETPLRTGSYVVYWSMPMQKPALPGGPPPSRPPAKAPTRDVNERTSKVRVELQPGPNTVKLDLQ